MTIFKDIFIPSIWDTLGKKSQIFLSQKTLSNIELQKDERIWKVTLLSFWRETRPTYLQYGYLGFIILYFDKPFRDSGSKS